MVGCNLLALLICVSAAVIAFRNFGATGRERDDHVHHLMEKGEGRTRYLSVIGNRL